MVIEPPGKMRVAGVLEIDNRVLVAVEKLWLENLGCFVRHAAEGELRPGVKRAFHKTAEKRSGGCAIETVVVVKNPDAHAVARNENLLECTKRARNATAPWCRNTLRYHPPIS